MNALMISILCLLIIMILLMGIIAFKLVSNQALKNNNKIFLDLANSELEKRESAIDYLVKPLKESLEKFDKQIHDIEKNRAGAYEGLIQQIKSLSTSQLNLQKETANLVSALRQPSVRGRWGEIQLQRVAELAGMLEYCDFETQFHLAAEDKHLRPDMVIKLPNQKTIIVDAKVPLSHFLDSLETAEENIKHEKLKAHANLIRAHIKQLSKKSYWEHIHPSPEFVILFLPGETFFSAALQVDPELIEHGAQEKVILATPTTLIALLKAIAYGWRQEKLAENAEKIKKLGKELGDRLQTFRDYFENVGDKLNKAVTEYNKAVATFETRLLNTARKFQELNGENEKTLEEISPLNQITRPLTKPENVSTEKERIN